MSKQYLLPEVSNRDTVMKHLAKGVFVLGRDAKKLEDDVFNSHDTDFGKLAEDIVAVLWPSTTAAGVDGPFGLEGWKIPFHAERLEIATGIYNELDLYNKMCG